MPIDDAASPEKKMLNSEQVSASALILYERRAYERSSTYCAERDGDMRKGLL